MQTLETLRAFLLGPDFPGATEEYPFGPETLTVKAGGKLFALLSLDEIPHRLALKCDPEEGDALRAAYVDTVTTAAYMHKRLWLSVILHGVDAGGEASLALPESELRDLIRTSYAHVIASLTRAQRAALTAPISSEER